MTANAARLSASQLRRRYVLALSLIALLTIAAQVLMQFIISDQTYDSRVVNIAGRQRMLSQKITKLSYYISSAESSDAAAQYRRDLTEALDLWQRSHAGLLRGDVALGLPGHNSTEVSALFDRIQPHHEAIVAAAKTVLSSPPGAPALVQGVNGIREHESDFLSGMDDIVFRYDHEANAKVASARRLEIGLMSTTLLVLMLEALFIFAPATRRIQRDMQELADREEDLDLLFSVSPTALLLIHRTTLTILHANQKVMELIGYSVEQLTKANLRDYLDSDYDANRIFLDKIGNGESLNEYEIILLDSRRSVIEALVSVREIRFSGQAVLVLGITNITELKRAQQTLEHYATFDEMTGMMNRRTGLMMLGKAMARFRRDGGQLTICYVDIDGLKAANDRHGHSEGDWLIRVVAEALSGAIRSSDAGIRLGGDEFLLILHDCSPEEASHLLGRAETCLREIESAERKEFPIAISYGIAVYSPERHSSAEELIAAADRLMYQAKEERRSLRTIAPQN